MMRIQTDVSESGLIFRVAGRLCGDSVTALEECWKGSPHDRKRSVDVTEVTLIDRAGWSLLRKMYRDGVTVSASGLATQTIIDQLSDKGVTK